MKIRNVLNPVYLFKNREQIVPALITRRKRFSSFCHRWVLAQGAILTANDRRIDALKDKHRGRRCFIIGNGPSLKIEDLDRLKDEVTFASNKVYLAFDSTEWRPTHYSVTDVLVAENNRSAIDELNLSKIFEETIRPFSKKESVIWLRLLPNPFENGEYKLGFSINALDGVYGGWTVIYLQMQLAFYMGIREIYLIGVDFSFEIPETTSEKCSSGTILKHQGEINHFHPDYRKPGETWSMPSLDKQYEAFLEGKRAVESQGGKIFNASRRTKLDVYQVVDFDSIVN